MLIGPVIHVLNLMFTSIDEMLRIIAMGCASQ